MYIEDVYEEFLNYLRAEKDVSKSTVSSYLTDLHVLVSFLKNNNITLDIQGITTVHLRKYVTYLKIDKNYKVRTIRRKIHSLSSFFKFCTEMEYILRDPTLPIHAPKEPSEIPIYILEEDLRKLIAAPLKYKNDFSLRDRAILSMFAFTGVRRQELIQANWDDIDFKQNIINIKHGKGNKQRVIPITSPLDSDLWAYLQIRLPLKNNALFISGTGNRISTTSLQLIFKKYLKLTGLEDKGYTLHKFRHSFGTLLIKNGANLFSVQKLLGHQDLNTTKIYTHLNMQDLNREIKKFPLSF